VTTLALDRDGIERTAAIIQPHLRVTPTVFIDGVEIGLGPSPLALKLELMQRAGSFKARGAFANLLTREIPPAGVAAASGGNHGTAVAYAAWCLGVPATIFVPRVSSPAKVARIRGYGARLHVVGELYAEALAACRDWVDESGALPVHAFDQEETILGQGTLGRELAGQAPDLDTLLVSVGGGGLIAGLAAWYRGAVRIVGVEPSAAPTLSMALAAGRPVDAPAGGIAADSLAPSRVGEVGFPLARAYVERVVLVDDPAIRRGQEALWDGWRLATEPGGAAAFAALLAGAYRPGPTERVGVVISGGNTAAVDFAG
jgi:threonine dehydratase